MDKKPLESRIKDALTEGTPDILSRVMASIETTEQMPKAEERKAVILSPTFMRYATAVACVFLFAVGILLGSLIPAVNVLPTADTSVYLDVNPSVELVLASDNTVLECIPGNDDATEILDGLKLDGVDMNTALAAIIGSMYMSGYLSTESNSILVSVDSDNDERANGLLTGITSKITSVLERSDVNCSIIAQKVDDVGGLSERAKENGVSLGKMHLVEKMIDALDEFTDLDVGRLSGMSIKDLDLMYSERDHGQGDFDEDIKEGTASGLGKDAIRELLEKKFGEGSRIIEECDFDFKIVHDEGKKPRLVYEVEIKFVGDDTEYTYIVDSLTGELIDTEIDTDDIDDDDDDDDDMHEKDDFGDSPDHNGGIFPDFPSIEDIIGGR